MGSETCDKSTQKYFKEFNSYSLAVLVFYLLQMFLCTRAVYYGCSFS